MYNHSMKDRWDRKKRSGFTIVEIMIFLAISGVLIVGVIAGSGVIVARHRYNDSVQNLAQTLRAQYSAVINTQIADRVPGLNTACLGPSLDEIVSGGQISAINYQQFFDASGNLKAGADAGRGRNNCLVYGITVTFGGNDGGSIQVSPLVGTDITTIADADSGLSDLELLQLSGANNLTVSFAGSTLNAPGNSFTNLNCRIQTARGSSTHDLEWGATIQAPNHNTLQATLLIFRSPRDGAIRTYVHNGPFMFNGVAIDFTAIDNANGGAGMGLKDINNGGANCQGNLIGAEGYNFYREANLNRFLYNSDDPDDQFFVREDLIICVNSDDLFALNGQRRMIRIKADGRNSTAIELIDLDAPLQFDSEGNPTPESNQC